MRSFAAIITALLANDDRFRRIGKSSAAVALVKKADGILLCHNSINAKHMAKEFEIPTLNIFDGEELLGCQRPFIIDQNAALMLMKEMQASIDSLRKEVQMLRGANSRLAEHSFAREDK